MGTKPQTLAYALTGSPVGLAAWIIEKFRTWSDCKGDLEAHLSRDVLLTNIMLYWITGTIGSSFWPCYARLHEPRIVPPQAGDQIHRGSRRERALNECESLGEELRRAEA